MTPKLDVVKAARVLRKLGVTNDQYLAWTGGQRLHEFAVANPTWTLAQWKGLLMENLSAIQR